MGIMSMYQEEYDEALDNFTEAIKLDPGFGVAYYNRAVVYRLMGETKLAEEDITRAIEVSHSLENAYFMRALIKKDLGDLEGALSDYDKANAANGEYTEVLFNRAYTLKLMGDYDAALSDVESLVVLEPENPANWNLKGNISLLYGEYNDAIEAYSEAISLDAQYAEAYYNRGLAYVMSHRPLQGCPDFVVSLDLGYEAADKLKGHFCGL
jgi:tetratricopeptide (TPR) repeat protein